jgi:methionine-rich copper-binding protein CopC
MLQRRLLVTGTALLLSILTYICTIALIQPSIASAHAYVIGSDPVDGSTVVQVPKEVHIDFNAAISPLSRAHVYFTQDGNQIDVGAAPSQVAPLDARELVIPIKNPSHQPEGSYEVIWSAMADGDGHTTEGIIGFNVGFSGFPGTPILGPSTSNDMEDIRTLDLTSSLAVLWEWFTLIALAGWIGILVMEQFILMDWGHGAALLAQVRKQTSSLQRLCLVTLLFGESIALLLRAVLLIKVQQSNALPPLLSLSVIAETSYGHIWLLRMALIALAMGCLYWTEQSKSPRLLSRSTWLLYTGLLTLLFVLTGPDAQVLQPHFSTILFDWLKIIGQGIWFGSVAYLGYVLLPLLKTKNRSYDAEALATLLQRLTPVVVASVSIQLLSLVFLSDASIHDLQQLSTDPYGFTLAVQWMMIAITVLLTTYILFVLRPRIMDKAQLSLALEGEGSDTEPREEVNTLSSAEAQATQSDLSGEKVGIPFSASVGRGLKLPIAMISVLSMGILLCSALMSFYAPPIVFPNVTYTNQSDISANAVNTQTKQIGPFSVTLELLPGHIDHPNTVIMLINDSHGKSITDARVRLAVNMQIMDMGTSHALITGGNPVYATTFDPHQAFNMAGPWVINVEIQSPNQQAAHDTFQVMLS